jgi:hypothetical protein
MQVIIRLLYCAELRKLIRDMWWQGLIVNNESGFGIFRYYTTLYQLLILMYSRMWHEIIIVEGNSGIIIGSVQLLYYVV